MHARLVRFGNSRGIRLPKAVVEATGLKADLELEVRNGAVIIRNTKRIRVGWAEAAAACHRAGEDALENWDAALADGVWG